MKKDYFSIKYLSWSMTVLSIVLFCSLSFTSCGDDDDEPETEQDGDGNNIPSGNEGGGDETSVYSWANMQGVWMEDRYEACAAEIAVYKQQNVSSGVYYNNDFRAHGIQFDGEGHMKELRVEMKAFHNSGALVFETIYAGDGEIVYWTDVEGDDYGSEQYTIEGNNICLYGQERYEIRTPNHFVEPGTRKVYVRVK